MLAQAYLFPPLSVGGASRAHTCPEHQRPLIEPCMRFARTRLSDHRQPPACTGIRPAWPSGLAATGETQERKRGVPASRQSPRRPPHQRQGESAAPSLGGGCVVLPLQTVLWATPTPDTAGRDFGSALYAPVEQAAHRGGSPVVPPGAIPACHPCYPGGPPMPWQP